MSVNDTPNDNDNPQIPTDAKVVPIDWVKATRERLAAEESTKASGPVVVEEDEGIPDEQEFEVVLRDESGVGPGLTMKFRGYMVATSVFVGFADKDGIVGSMVPMSNVLYVKSTSQ